MTIQLLPATQEVIDILLEKDDEWSEESDKRRSEALAKVSALQDKDQLEKYIIEWLDTGMGEAWPRTWSLSTLSVIGLPDGIQRVLNHLKNPPEDFAWTRHFALINAANFNPFPQAEIEQAAQDLDELPRATAFRLLIANGFQQYETNLIDMLQNQLTPNTRWAAARALRNRTDLKMKRLRPSVERKFIPRLVETAANKNMYLDTRWECIQTLASFDEKKMVATALAELLMKDPDATLRRYYMDALVKLGQAEESKAALIRAVEDTDAQIRWDAANALKNMVAAEDIINSLLQLALTPGKNAGFLVDALRHIDVDLAAKALRDALNNPDPKMSSRANDLLTMLGGQTATQILLGERTKALERYTSILTDADKDVQDHFKQLISQARAAFWISMTMHTIVFLIGVGVLVGSLVLALRDGLNTVGTWVGGVGVGTAAIVLTTFYRNPLQNVRDSLNSLMQVDVVFLGYIRQINQIDATFKHMFLEAHDFGTTHMQATVAEMKTTVNKILEEIKQYIENK